MTYKSTSLVIEHKETTLATKATIEPAADGHGQDRMVYFMTHFGTLHFSNLYPSCLSSASSAIHYSVNTVVQLSGKK